jgi:hypothetical protein
VLSVMGKDQGPLAGAHAKLIRGKPMPQHGIVYQAVVGFQSGPGASTILITFADGTYLERRVNFGMVIDERRTFAEVAAEIARFNTMAALAA